MQQRRIGRPAQARERDVSVGMDASVVRAPTVRRAAQPITARRMATRRGTMFTALGAAWRLAAASVPAGRAQAASTFRHWSIGAIAPSRPTIRPDPPLDAREIAPVPVAQEQKVGTALAATPAREGPIDYMLLIAVAALLLFGLLMVYSASQLDVPGDPGYWARRQAVWAALGVVALLATAGVDYHAWRHVSLPLMGLTLALLVAVLAFGHTSYGAQRWLSLRLFSFQPSELAKLALTLYIADWLANKGEQIRSFAYGLVPFSLVVGLVLALVLVQNDMGTAAIIAALAVAMFFVAGASLLQLVPTLALGAAAFAAVAARSGFRRARLSAFLHPLPPGCADAASYQVCQGLISLGSGGVFGHGLGASVQKAGYLPNPFTDSIFAVIGEELGLVGCVGVLALFALLAYQGFRAGRRAPDAYGALLACGITCWLAVQALVNVGSVAAAIPFTGVPLPFVSFGGSSLVTALAGVGVLLNVSRAARRAPRP